MALAALTGGAGGAADVATGAETVEEAEAGAQAEAAASSTIYRGVAQDHFAFSDALQGRATPGDPLGDANPALHNAGFTSGSRLTSWSTDRTVAETFAGKDGVILSSTTDALQIPRS